MLVHLGTDHGAFDLKHFLIKELAEAGYELVDHGAAAYDPDDDYPQYVFSVAEAVASDPDSVGIVLGTTGIGECIAANKVRGVRCALACDAEAARIARDHVDANVLAIGGRRQSLDAGFEIVRAFLETPFSQDVRHERRLEQIADREALDLA